MSIRFRDLPVYDHLGATRNFEQLSTASIANNELFASVKEFGAKGNGEANDTGAIQEAINAQGKNGSVFLPAGRYLITSALSIPFEHFTLRGAGYRSSTIILKAGSNSSMITTPDDKVQRYGLLLKDFGLEGNSAGQSGSSAAISIRGMNETRIEGLYILEPRGDAIRIGQATGGIFNTVPMITRCVIRGDKETSQENGINLNQGSSDAQVIGCDIGFFKKGAGILLSEHSGFELVGNQCWQNKYGYQLFAANRGRIVGCLSDLARQYGFVAQNIVDTTFVGCQSRESGQEAAKTYDGVFVEGTTEPNTCFNTIFSGCRIMGTTTRNAIRLQKNVNLVEVVGCNLTGNEGGISKGAENVVNIKQATLEAV